MKLTDIPINRKVIIHNIMATMREGRKRALKNKDNRIKRMFGWK